jgi:hypothetical protein
VVIPARDDHPSRPRIAGALLVIARRAQHAEAISAASIGIASLRSQ